LINFSGNLPPIINASIILELLKSINAFLKSQPINVTFPISESINCDHHLLKIISVKANKSDGSEVFSKSLNGVFKKGIFVAMSDDKTFHFYRWEDIAGDELKIRRH